MTRVSAGTSFSRVFVSFANQALQTASRTLRSSARSSGRAASPDTISVASAPTIAMVIRSTRRIFFLPESQDRLNQGQCRTHQNIGTLPTVRSRQITAVNASRRYSPVRSRFLAWVQRQQHRSGGRGKDRIVQRGLDPEGNGHGDAE